VAEDERENGRRALLNLGHTFAHALEAETRYSGALLHGEAVAMGMIMAFELSARLGLCPDEDAARVRAHFNAVGIPVSPAHNTKPLSADVLLTHMAQDKKVKDGEITFVLVRGIGHAFLTQDVPRAELISVLEAAIAA
jgi:3-dehydroquinate synthase